MRHTRETIQRLRNPWLVVLWMVLLSLAWCADRPGNQAYPAYYQGDFR